MGSFGRIVAGSAGTAPALPRAERHAVPGRGTMTVRRIEGPPGAPTVLLLHGWIATGALNWFQVFGPLAEQFSVIAPDLRGHGGGVRSWRRFRLADCADDMAALLEHLDAPPVIAVGYSMGGTVAQLLWHRHRARVAGLVLAATGAEFVFANRERYAFSALANAIAGTTRVGGAVTWLPTAIRRRLVSVPEPADEPARRWARREMSAHNVRMLAEAGQAIATFSSKPWIHDVDVPTTVVITEHDTAVDPMGQFRMALAIPGARIVRVAGGHAAAALPEFGPALVEACAGVARRIGPRAGRDAAGEQQAEAPAGRDFGGTT